MSSIKSYMRIDEVIAYIPKVEGAHIIVPLDTLLVFYSYLYLMRVSLVAAQLHYIERAFYFPSIRLIVFINTVAVVLAAYIVP